MEEILASIKRVIAEEGRAPTGASRGGRGRRAAPPPDDEDEDVLELSEPAGEGEPLLSEDKAEATRQKLAALAAMQRQSEEGSSYGVPANDGPLEALVREMLKPMLKEWLDERLPEIIEDMVAREIARITGRSF